MKKSLSWKAACSSATQEIAHILCSTKVDYHFDNNLPPVTVLRRLNPLMIILSFPLRSFLILVFLFNCNIHCHVCFLAKKNSVFMSLLPNTCHMPCPSHPPWFDHPHNTGWTVPGPEHLPQCCIVRHPQPVFFLTVRCNFLQACKRS